MSAKFGYELVKQDYRMKLDHIAGVAVNSKGEIIICGRTRPDTPIVIFDKNGVFTRYFGKGLIGDPHGVCVDEHDNIWVTDGRRHVVHKFTSEGELLMTLGNLDQPSNSGCVNGDFKTVKRGAEPFYVPAKTAIRQSNGHIYVADGYGNTRVHHFDSEGKLLHSWGEPGTEPGQFHILHGIGIDQENGDVYIADRENERVQIFDENGNLKKVWDGFYRPSDVVIKNGYIYVGEIGQMFFVDNILYEPGTRRHWSQVRVFDMDYNEITTIGTSDCGAHGSFFAVHGLAVDDEDNLFVCEVAWPISEAVTAWPMAQGVFPPDHTHCLLQKFRRV